MTFVHDYREGSPPRLMSVVIPCLNAASTLPEQLDALAHQAYDGPFEVLVADNGSDDGTAEVAGHWVGRLPGLRVVDVSQRRGASRARNAAAKVASGDFLAFCDADDVASPGWLAAMAEAARNSDLVGGPLERGQLNEGQEWRSWMTEPALPVSLDFLPYAHGANLGIRSAVLEAVGGWNESYVGGGEDVELCWRAQLAGFRIAFAPEAVMHYRLRNGLRDKIRQSYGYGVAVPRLYRQFRCWGAPPCDTRLALKRWAWALLHVPHACVSPRLRDPVIRRLAFRWGCLQGSLRYRVVCL